MKNKKYIIIITIIIVLIISVVIVFKLLNNKKNDDFNKNEDNWNHEVYLPIKVKYDNDKKISNLYVKNKKVNFSGDYEMFDSFLNISKNNIAINALRNNKKSLFIINLNGNVVKSMNEILDKKTDKNYTGNYVLDNNYLKIYYADNNVCDGNDGNVDILYVKTLNDSIDYTKKEKISTKEFLDLYQNYC